MTCVWEVGRTKVEAQPEAVTEFILRQLSPIQRLGHDSEPCPSLLGALKADSGGAVWSGLFQVVKLVVGGFLLSVRSLSAALGARMLKQVFLSNQVVALKKGLGEGPGDRLRCLVAIVGGHGRVRYSKPGLLDGQGEELARQRQFLFLKQSREEGGC
jgi:hypothetical protein